MELLNILKRESEHATNVYLYEENGFWYAYGHSAKLLSKLLEGVANLKQVVCDKFSTMVKVEIDLYWLSGFNIISCSDNELVIACAQQNR